MKFRNLCLLVFIGTSLFAKPNDLGYISYTLSEKYLQIPIERISFNREKYITITAYGHITEPIRSTIILSLVLHDFSTDQEDLDMKNCWLSLDQKNDDSAGCYISFGFQDSYAFYSSHKESTGDIRKAVTNTAELSILKIENQNNILFVAGNFTSSHGDQRDGREKNIKIQNGHFTFFVEGLENTIAAEEYSGEVNNGSQSPTPEQPSSTTTSECTLSPAYYFIVSQPYSSPPEEEQQVDLLVPDPDQVQPLPNNPTPQPVLQPETRNRTLRTDRIAPVIIPERTPRFSSHRDNPQPADTTRTRDLGIRRGRR